jgi:hypothetical protein
MILILTKQLYLSILNSLTHSVVRCSSHARISNGSPRASHSGSQVPASSDCRQELSEVHCVGCIFIIHDEQGREYLL